MQTDVQVKLSLRLARRPYHCWNEGILALAAQAAAAFRLALTLRVAGRASFLQGHRPVEPGLSPARKGRLLLCRGNLLAVTKLVLCWFCVTWARSRKSKRPEGLKLNNPGPPPASRPYSQHRKCQIAEAARPRQLGHPFKGSTPEAWNRSDQFLPHLQTASKPFQSLSGLVLLV